MKRELHGSMRKLILLNLKSLSRLGIENEYFSSSMSEPLKNKLSPTYKPNAA